MKPIKTGRLVKSLKIDSDSDNYRGIWSNRHWNFCARAVEKYFDIPDEAKGIYLEIHRDIDSIIKSFSGCDIEKYLISNYLHRVFFLEKGDVVICFPNYEARLEILDFRTFERIEETLSLGVEYYAVCFYEE